MQATLLVVLLPLHAARDGDAEHGGAAARAWWAARGAPPRDATTTEAELRATLAGQLVDVDGGAPDPAGLGTEHRQAVRAALLC